MQTIRRQLDFDIRQSFSSASASPSSSQQRARLLSRSGTDNLSQSQPSSSTWCEDEPNISEMSSQCSESKKLSPVSVSHSVKRSLSDSSSKSLLYSQRSLLSYATPSKNSDSPSPLKPSTPQQRQPTNRKKQSVMSQGSLFKYFTPKKSGDVKHHIDAADTTASVVAVKEERVEIGNQESSNNHLVHLKTEPGIKQEILDMNTDSPSVPSPDTDSPSSPTQDTDSPSAPTQDTDSPSAPSQDTNSQTVPRQNTDSTYEHSPQTYSKKQK